MSTIPIVVQAQDVYELADEAEERLAELGFDKPTSEGSYLLGILDTLDWLEGNLLARPAWNTP